MKKKRFIKLTALASAVVMSASSLLSLGVGATAEQSASRITVADSDRSIPSGTRRTSVNVNGRSVLNGRVLVIDDITYVPMFKFADWLGVFTYSLSDSGTVSTGRISGENLQITAVENKIYIIANGRYFYTVGKVMDIDGEIYVPIEPLVKALNSYASKNADGTYLVRSGDTRLLKNASQIYREDEVYWLAKIISAEARGESMQGKIAVGNVVLNRVRSKQFPNTIYGVIFDKKNGVQFAPTSNGTIYNSATADSIIAARICLEGYTLSNEILYFFNPRYASGTWVKNNREYAFTIGNHAFYN